MAGDETIPISPKVDLFEYGDRTILAIKSQEFALDDVAVASAATAVEVTLTIEQKLDAIIRSIESLQRRLDSLDMTVARLVNR